MAIVGAHVLLYSPEAEALRGVLRDVFGWGHVDAGDGWLIFELPPSEIGIHPSASATTHQLSLMCDDLTSTMADLRAKGIVFVGEPHDAGYGIEVVMELPGGVQVLLYEPRHPVAVSFEPAE